MEWELLTDQPLWQKLIKKGFWLYFFTILIAPTGYFIRVLVSNAVSVEDIGIIYSVMGLMWVISAYHDLGLTEALQYHLPKYRIQKKYNAFKTSIYFTMIVQTISGFAIAIVLFFWANYLSTNYFHSPESANIIKIFCLYFLGVNFYNILYSIYIAFQDVIQYKIIEGIRWYTTLIFTLIFFLLWGLNITNFTRAWILWLWLALTISGVIFRKKYKYTLQKGVFQRNTSLIKKQIKYAFRIFIGINVIYLLGQVDQQFIMYFLGAEKAWYYANYLSLILSFSILTGPLLWYLFPLTTELIEKKEYQKLTELKNILYKYFSIFAISISGLFIVLGPEIATILFGQKFIYSWQLLAYSAWFLIFYTLFSINLSLLAGMGKVKERAKIIGIALLTNIILNLIFIHIRGILWVIAATMVSWIMLFVMSYRIANKEHKITFSWIFFIKNIATVIIICIGIQSIKKQYFTLEDTSRYYNLLVFIIISIIYYLIIIEINYPSLKLLKQEIKKIYFAN